MAALITILISLLGFGTPTDFEHLTEAELNYEIAIAEENHNVDGGNGGDGWWDPGVME